MRTLLMMFDRFKMMACGMLMVLGSLLGPHVVLHTVSGCLKHFDHRVCGLDRASLDRSRPDQVSRLSQAAWVVTRPTPTRLIVSDEKRWAEPLDQHFQSVLGQNLSQILGTGKITNYPRYADTISTIKSRCGWSSVFEAAEDGQSWLTAVWTIRNGQDGHELASGQSPTNAPIQDVMQRAGWR
jgi:hypothetical protein